MDNANPDFVGSQSILNVGTMLDNSNLINSNLGFDIRTSIYPDFLEASGIEHISHEFTDETNATNFKTKLNFQGPQEIYSRKGHNAEVLYPNNQEGNFYNMENGSNVPKNEYCVYDFQEHDPDIRICGDNLCYQISHSEDKSSSFTPGRDTILSMNLNELKIDNEFDFNQILDMRQKSDRILINNQQQENANCEERNEFPIYNERSSVEERLLTNYLSENEIQLSTKTQTSSYFTLKYNHISNDNQNTTTLNSLHDFSTIANKSYKSELNDRFLSKNNKCSTESEMIFPVPSNPTENSFNPTFILSLNQQNGSNHREISFLDDVSLKELQLTCNLNEGMTTNFEQKCHKCEICMKIFRTKYHLEQHKRIHTGDKSFICNICHQTFYQKCNLNRHLRIHTGVKPFSCSICSKAFKQKGHLNVHLRIHTGVKPFSCSICYKAFKLKHHLNSHFRTHSKEKPYSCGICDTTFSHQSSLKRHILTHTHDTPL